MQEEPSLAADFRMSFEFHSTCSAFTHIIRSGSLGMRQKFLINGKV